MRPQEPPQSPLEQEASELPPALLRQLDEIFPLGKAVAGAPEPEYSSYDTLLRNVRQPVVRALTDQVAVPAPEPVPVEVMLEDAPTEETLYDPATLATEQDEQRDEEIPELPESALETAPRPPPRVVTPPPAPTASRPHLHLLPPPPPRTEPELPPELDQELRGWARQGLALLESIKGHTEDTSKGTTRIMAELFKLEGAPVGAVLKELREGQQEIKGLLERLAGAPVGPLDGRRGLFRAGQERCYIWLSALLGTLPALMLVGLISGVVDNGLDAVPLLVRWLLSWALQ